MVGDPLTAAPPYESFAPFYDAFTDGSDYEMWTAHVLDLASRHGLTGTRLLDVACGTGKSFLPFLSRGFEATGADVSPAMLAQAARKTAGAVLVEADMRTLPVLGQFDLVVCFDDSLNHLLDEADLVAALRSMATNLAADGLLMFDMNTLLAYRSTFAVDRVFESEGVTFAWRGESRPDVAAGCYAAASIDCFVPGPDGCHRRTTSRHEQRHFAPHKVTALLARAELDCLGVYGVLDDGSHVPEVDETTQLKVMYVARLAKGGDIE